MTRAPGVARPEVVGHQGAAAHAPGNSRAAFEAALDIGVDRLECDVRRSADGALVLLHDEHVPGPAGRPVPVDRLTAADLRAHLPDLLTLDELAELAGRTPLMIDLKATGYEDAVAEIIRRHALADRASVASTHALSLRRFRARFPGMEQCLSTGHLTTSTPTTPGRAVATAVLRASLPALIRPAMAASGASAATLHQRVVTPAVVRAVRTAGRRLFVWTVDADADIARVIALDPDGIISNRPDAVRAALGSPGTRE